METVLGNRAGRGRAGSLHVQGVEAAPTHITGWRKYTHRQDLLIALFGHTGPPALCCLLFKERYKALWVEDLIQLVQGALLSCPGWPGHAVEVQLQGTWNTKAVSSRGVPHHWQPGLPCCRAGSWPPAQLLARIHSWVTITNSISAHPHHRFPTIHSYSYPVSLNKATSTSIMHLAWDKSTVYPLTISIHPLVVYKYFYCSRMLTT